MAHINDTPLSSKQIYLDSKDATFKDEDHSRCLVYFKESLSPPHNVDIIASVVSFTCPMSFYIVNSSNDTLNFGTDSSSGSYTIPHGNYTATELAQLLQTYVNVVSTVGYDKVSNKFIFNALVPKPSFYFQSSSTCLELLGFSKGTTHSSNSFFGGHQLLSNLVVNLSGINSVYIHSNLLTYSLDSRSGGLNNILARVPIDTDRNGILHYNPQFPYKTILRNKIIDYISIKLEDDEERSIDFNGQHWAITLQIDYRYQKDAKTMGNLLEMDEKTEEEKDDKTSQDKV